MEWVLREGPVYLIVAGIVFFIVFLAIQSRKEARDKDKPNKV